MILGTLSAALLAHVWVVFLAPVRWNLHYLGGSLGPLAALGLSIAVSILAGRLGSRRWYAVTAIGVITLAYLGWFFHPPMWN